MKWSSKKDAKKEEEVDVETVPSFFVNAFASTSFSTPETSSKQTRDMFLDHGPNFGSRIKYDRCKYRCPNCDYFMSCSDFD